MKKLVVLFLTVISINQANARPISPSDSVCLESAVNQVIATSEADLHLVRDSKTGLIARLINLDTDESFDLAYLGLNEGIEFLSFENSEHLFNIWAQPTGADTCEVLEVRIDDNDGGI